MLLEDQTAKGVISILPLQVVAIAVNCWDCSRGLGPKVTLVGLIAMDWMQPTVTVTGCVPLMAVFFVEVAVTVAVPVLTDWTKPPAVIVATD